MIWHTYLNYIIRYEFDKYNVDELYKIASFWKGCSYEYAMSDVLFIAIGKKKFNSQGELETVDNLENDTYFGMDFFSKVLLELKSKAILYVSQCKVDPLVAYNTAMEINKIIRFGALIDKYLGRQWNFSAEAEIKKVLGEVNNSEGKKGFFSRLFNI